MLVGHFSLLFIHIRMFRGDAIRLTALSGNASSSVAPRRHPSTEAKLKKLQAIKKGLISPFDAPTVKVDMTKRKSLQPSNLLAVHAEDAGKGFLTTDSNTVTKAQMKRTADLEDVFTHKFFGTQLAVGNVVIASNLPKQLHRLEISKQGVFVDHVPLSIHEGDWERIKDMIRQSRV